MDGLAQLYDRRGSYQQAEALFADAIPRARKSLGENHYRTLSMMNDLADTYAEEGKPAQAEALYSEVLPGQRRAVGETNYDTLWTAARVGRARLLQRKYAEADTALRDAMSGYRKAEPKRWERYACQSLAGSSLLAQKRFAEVEPLLIAGYEGMQRLQERVAVKERLRFTDAGSWIVALYEAWGKPEKAAEWRGKLRGRDGA